MGVRAVLVVWERASSYNGTSKVSTWVFGIAYRKALKALQRFDEPVHDDGADARDDWIPGPEQLIGQRELRAALGERGTTGGQTAVNI